MSKLAEFRAAELALAKQIAAFEERKNDPELKKEIAFIEALDELLTKHDMSRSKLFTFLSLEARAAKAPAPSTSKSGRKTPVFTEKQYRNPHTGEVITVKLGSHGTYKKWVSEFGKATVEAWKIAG